MEQNNRTLIKQYSSGLVKGFIEKVKSIDTLNHPLGKGELRELFVTELISNWLTSQYSVTSGFIVDIQGNQSKQTDIIIYDSTLLPPFIKQSNLGVVPIECVLATIEVKSFLDKSELINSEENAKYLNENLKFHESFGNAFIVQSIIGLKGDPISELSANNLDWIKPNIKHLRAICHISKYSWLQYPPPSNKWVFRDYNLETNEETKRFFAWLLDTVRNKSKRRHEILTQNRISLMSLYIRDQE